MRTQGHAQAMIDARHGCTTVAVAGSAASGTAAFSSVTQPLRRTFRGEPGQVSLVRDFVSSCLERHCPAEAVQDILACANELAASACCRWGTDQPRFSGSLPARDFLSGNCRSVHSRTPG